MPYLTPEDIKQYTPIYPPKDNPAQPLSDGLKRAGYDQNGQLAGRHFPIACVALEITQRCNLDCSLCYLSDLAEAVQDVPLYELKRRIKEIFHCYGAHTNIQITGGDPTLRSTEDLVEIIQTIKSFKMRCALFTNGIKASRAMLKELAKAGLDDIAFHVDMSQERKGYTNEASLNPIREEYIHRASGLSIRIMFNTTIFADNMQEIPMLVRFFTRHASFVTIASFQMQADTGRGVLRKRDKNILTQENVMDLISEGAGIKLLFDFPLVGHPQCNTYTSILCSGSARVSLFDQSVFFEKLFATIARNVSNHWSPDARVIPFALKALMYNLGLIPRAFMYLWQKFWALKTGILRGKGVHRIGFFVHNFMDANALEKERCEACVFMVATAEGPMSMCVHNAKRDEMIAKVVPEQPNQQGWDPLAGQKIIADELSLKRLKGRRRQQKISQKNTSSIYTKIPIENYK